MSISIAIALVIGYFGDCMAYVCGALALGVIAALFVQYNADAKIAAVARKHMDTLVRKRTQLVFIDDYGHPFKDKWFQELDYFIERNLGYLPEGKWAHAKTVIDRAVVESINLVVAKKSNTRTAIDETVAKHLNTVRNEGFNDLEAYEDEVGYRTRESHPVDFEKQCATILEECGWRARTTKGSGDQGVDVIGQKGKVRLVLQCKLYSKPVGNKAVQEISAGRAYEHAHFAAVVTNSSYTISAKQAAASNKVTLLHYTELAKYALTLLPESIQREIAFKKYAEFIKENLDNPYTTVEQLQKTLPQPITEIESEVFASVIKEWEQRKYKA